jgi:hypothetical protein
MRVLHPVRLRFFTFMDEQHAATGGKFIAKHQAARALRVVVGDFDRIALSGEFDPRRTGARAAAEQQGTGDQDEQAHGQSPGWSPTFDERSPRVKSGRLFMKKPFTNGQSGGTMRAPSEAQAGFRRERQKPRHEVLTFPERAV